MAVDYYRHKLQTCASQGMESSFEPCPPTFAVPSLEALMYFTFRDRSVMVAKPVVKNEIYLFNVERYKLPPKRHKYGDIVSCLDYSLVPLQVDYKDIWSTFQACKPLNKPTQ